MASSTQLKLTTTLAIILLLAAASAPRGYAECETETHNSCNNKSKALPLKIIAIVSILATSMIGVCLPLFSRSVPALHPDRSLFVIVKAFAAGIILATGFMHVLPDSFDMLWSDCLKENPWHKFPFTGFVAMLSATATMMIDTLATSYYERVHFLHNKALPVKEESGGGGGHVHGAAAVAPEGHVHVHTHATHGHAHGSSFVSEDVSSAELVRHRVVSQVCVVRVLFCYDHLVLLFYVC